MLSAQGRLRFDVGTLLSTGNGEHVRPLILITGYRNSYVAYVDMSVQGPYCAPEQRTDQRGQGGGQPTVF